MNDALLSSMMMLLLLLVVVVFSLLLLLPECEPPPPPPQGLAFFHASCVAFLTSLRTLLRRSCRTVVVVVNVVEAAADVVGAYQLFSGEM